MEIPYTFAGIPAVPLDKAKIAVLPVAYDGTTSYNAGARFGPQEIILASRFLEMYDERLGFEPVELGITTLPEVWPDLSSAEAAVADVERRVRALLQKKKFPVVLGGEHSITAGVVKAFQRTDPDISVVVLDAHADLRESYQDTGYNHACVSRRILEMGLPISILGVRSIPSEDLPLLSSPDKNLKLLFASELKKSNDWLSLIEADLKKKVYLSIDLDFFDPAYMPAVGTPEPGGFGWDEANVFFQALARKHRIVGFDVVELNGALHHTPSAYFASRLVYRLLGLAAGKR
jgi:agmatinase